jgi:glycosyltransferase involved in cell wall biosynthesis
MRYAVIDFELTQPPSGPIRVGRRRGSWVLLRVRGMPVGWLKFARGERGSCLHPHDIIELANQRYGLRIFELLTARPPAIPVERLPSISIIVCTRNHPDVLKRQLQSLSRLRYAAPHEVIVVDNAPSDDQTREVCELFPAIRYICEPTPGLDFARNAGLHAARHEIVAYTDDDACVDPEWLTGLGKNYLRPQVQAVTGLTLPMELRTGAQYLFELYGGMQRGFHRKVYHPTSKWNAYYPLGSGAFGAGVNMSIRRQFAIDIGGFDEALDTGSLTRGGGDLDMMARVIRNGGTLVYEPSAVVWHQHRLTYKQLKGQMWDYGYGFYAYLAKYAEHDLELSNHALLLMWKVYQWYFKRMRETLNLKLRRKEHFPIRMQLQEMAGALFGAFVYNRSVNNARRLQQQRAKRLTPPASTNTTLRRAA